MYDQIDHQSLEPDELPTAVYAGKLQGASAGCVIIGTMIGKGSKFEATQGRLLMFSIDEKSNKLERQTAVDVDGPVGSVSFLRGKVLVTIQGKVLLLCLT